MHDLEYVEIVQTTEQLFQNTADDVLVQVVSRFDEINYGASVTKFCHNLVVSIPLKNLIQLDYIRMIQLFQQVKFCKNLVHLEVINILFFNAFDCPYFVCFETDGFVNTAVRPLSNFLVHCVIAPYIFFPQKNELLLIYLYSSIIILYFF